MPENNELELEAAELAALQEAEAARQAAEYAAFLAAQEAFEEAEAAHNEALGAYENDPTQENWEAANSTYQAANNALNNANTALNEANSAEQARYAAAREAFDNEIADITSALGIVIPEGTEDIAGFVLSEIARLNQEAQDQYTQDVGSFRDVIEALANLHGIDLPDDFADMDAAALAGLMNTFQDLIDVREQDAYDGRVDLFRDAVEALANVNNIPLPDGFADMDEAALIALMSTFQDFVDNRELDSYNGRVELFRDAVEALANANNIPLPDGFEDMNEAALIALMNTFQDFIDDRELDEYNGRVDLFRDAIEALANLNNIPLPDGFADMNEEALVNLMNTFQDFVDTREQDLYEGRVEEFRGAIETLAKANNIPLPENFADMNEAALVDLMNTFQDFIDNREQDAFDGRVEFFRTAIEALANLNNIPLPDGFAEMDEFELATLMNTFQDFIDAREQDLYEGRVNDFRDAVEALAKANNIPLPDGFEDMNEAALVDLMNTFQGLIDVREQDLYEGRVDHFRDAIEALANANNIPLPDGFADMDEEALVDLMNTFQDFIDARELDLYEGRVDNFRDAIEVLANANNIPLPEDFADMDEAALITLMNTFQDFIDAREQDLYEGRVNDFRDAIEVLANANSIPLPDGFADMDEEALTDFMNTFQGILEGRELDAFESRVNDFRDAIEALANANSIPLPDGFADMDEAALADFMNTFQGILEGRELDAFDGRVNDFRSELQQMADAHGITLPDGFDTMDITGLTNFRSQIDSTLSHQNIAAFNTFISALRALANEHNVIIPADMQDEDIEIFVRNEILRLHGIAEDDFDTAWGNHLREQADFDAAWEAHLKRLEAWNEWQVNRPKNPDGSDGEGIVVTVEMRELPAGSETGNTSGFSMRPLSSFYNFGPDVDLSGLYLHRPGGGNSPLQLIVTDEANMGTLVFGARHGQNSQITTIEIYEAGTFTLNIWPNNNMSQWGVVGGTFLDEPVFDKDPPNPPDAPTLPQFPTSNVTPYTLPDLPEGINEIEIELPELPEGQSDVTINLPDLPEGINEITIRLPDLPEELNEIKITLPDLPEGLDEILINLPDLPEGLEKIKINLPDLPEELGSIKINLPGLPEELEEILISLPGLPDGLETIIISIPNLPVGLAEITIELPDLPDGLNEITIDLPDLPEGLIEIVLTLPDVPGDPIIIDIIVPDQPELSLFDFNGTVTGPGDPPPVPDDDPDDTPDDTPDPGPELLTVIPPAPAPDDEPVIFEIPDMATPLAAPPVPDDLQAMTIIEDPAVPLAQPADLGEVAGFLTTGLILATLIAAVVGNSIRKMRTEEVIEEEEI